MSDLSLEMIELRQKRIAFYRRYKHKELTKLARERGYNVGGRGKRNIVKLLAKVDLTNERTRRISAAITIDLSPAQKEAREQVLSFYPMLASCASVINAMPAESVRDFKSDWAKKEAAPWSPWLFLQQDLDSIAHSPNENDRTILTQLLGYIAGQSAYKIASSSEVGLHWADLYLFASYALLSDVNTVPLILAFAPSYMESLLSTYRQTIKKMWMEWSDGRSHPREVIWDISMLNIAVRSPRAAKWIVSFADENDFSLGEFWLHNVHIAREMADRGDTSLEMAKRLLDYKEMDRLTNLVKWIDYTSLWQFQELFREILHSDCSSLVIAIVDVLERLNTGLLNRLVTEALLWFRFHRSILSMLTDQRLGVMKTIFSSISDPQKLFVSVVNKKDIELLNLYERIGLGLKWDNISTTIPQFRLLGSNYEVVHVDWHYNSLICVLRNDLTFLFDRMMELYNPDPVALLCDLMEDISPFDKSTQAIEYLLGRYHYTPQELYSAIANSNNKKKTIVVLKKLQHFGVDLQL